MTTLFWLLLAIGLAPLAAGVVFLRPWLSATWPPPHVGSILLCALAFNLTFFWQELWLVIPKALTPGLHPILYHNNHEWTGDAPVAELLQGTGALATLASGLAFWGLLALARRASATWRLFLFWMAFQGAYQSLTQLAIGSLLTGNDVGRALAYLHVGAPAKSALLVLAAVAMALAGAMLARACPIRGEQRATARTRAFVQEMLLTAMAAVVLTIPFREPRNIVEVALVPLFVNLVGIGWLTFGAAIDWRGGGSEDCGRSGIVGPAIALVVTLFVFQLALRPGIAF